MRHFLRAATIVSYGLCLAWAHLLIGSVNAQQVFGRILGTVTQATGAPVSQAKVTITDLSRGTSVEATTDASGNYLRNDLVPGTYRVTIDAPGFQRVVSNPLDVGIDIMTSFNATLQTGNGNRPVQLTASAPLLQTDRANVAQTLTSADISQLPTIDRNIQTFTLLDPGTIRTSASLSFPPAIFPQRSVREQVNGLPFYLGSYYLDGTVNRDEIYGVMVVNPPLDSVAEAKQANQDFDAEFDSFAAGLFTYSTKSGTNSFHGSAFDYLEVNTPGFQDFGRNPFTENTPIFTGNTTANASADQNIAYTPTTHRNQFGGSIGGPIMKDKLFFFGDAQLTREHLGGSVLTSVPTAQDRTGNLSDWLALGPQYQIYCPQNSTANVGRPVPGNILSTGFCGTLPGTAAGTFLSPQAKALLNYFQLPDTGAGLPYNNYETNGTLAGIGNQWDTRWDYYHNDKNIFFGRYSYAGFSEHAPGAFGDVAGGPSFSSGFAGDSQILNQNLATGWTYTKSPTTINEFRFGYLREHVNENPNGFGTTPASQAGIPNLNTSAQTSGMPAIVIQGLSALVPFPSSSGFALGYSLAVNDCNCPLTDFDRELQFVDNFSHIAGKHSFKFGADIRYAKNLYLSSDSHRAGELTFNNSSTATNGGFTGGLGLGSFLLGDVTGFQRYVSSTTDAQEQQKRFFWYGQDTWRPTAKLTITYGVRWEMVFPETVNGAGNGAELNVNTGLVDVFGVGSISNHGYQDMNWHNFAPRVAIAYQLGSKTVVRAGYGWTYSLGAFGSNFGDNVTQNPPVLVNQVLTPASVCGANNCPVFTLAQGPPTPTIQQPGTNGTFAPPGTGVALTTRPGTLTLPVAYAYNFTVQHQLTSKISISGAYVGNSTRHGPLGVAGGEDYDENRILFVPGYTGNLNLLRPFDGLYGPRYNYGWAEPVNCYCNDANSQYNAFQAMFAVRTLAGYTLRGNYTYQSEQGDGNGPDPGYTFLYDRALGYGNSSYVPHQEWVLANFYDIPFGHGRHFGSNTNKYLDYVFGGWNFSAIFTYYSGIPFMPTIGSYPAGAGQPYTGPNSVPNLGSGSPYAANRDRNQWIVGGFGGPFLLPAANAFGNYPINSLYGPQFVNVDASIMKVFSIKERLRFTLRMDATNALNHTNLGLPNNDITSAMVGQITNIAFNGNNYSMRRVQFSGRFTW